MTKAEELNFFKDFDMGSPTLVEKPTCGVGNLGDAFMKNFTKDRLSVYKGQGKHQAKFIEEDSDLESLNSLKQYTDSVKAEKAREGGKPGAVMDLAVDSAFTVNDYQLAPEFPPVDTRKNLAECFSGNGGGAEREEDCGAILLILRSDQYWRHEKALLKLVGDYQWQAVGVNTSAINCTLPLKHAGSHEENKKQKKRLRLAWRAHLERKTQRKMVKASKKQEKVKAKQEMRRRKQEVKAQRKEQKRERNNGNKMKMMHILHAAGGWRPFAGVVKTKAAPPAAV